MNLNITVEISEEDLGLLLLMRDQQAHKALIAQGILAKTGKWVANQPYYRATKSIALLERIANAIEPGSVDRHLANRRSA